MTEETPIDTIVDNILVGDSASDISDSIKDALMSKAVEKIDSARPSTYNSIFDESNVDEEVYVEREDKLNEAPWQVTGPHSYKTGDGHSSTDVTVKNTPSKVGKVYPDDKKGRSSAPKRGTAHGYADKMNDKYGAPVYRVEYVPDKNKK